MKSGRFCVTSFRTREYLPCDACEPIMRRFFLRYAQIRIILSVCTQRIGAAHLLKN